MAEHALQGIVRPCQLNRVPCSHYGVDCCSFVMQAALPVSADTTAAVVAALAGAEAAAAAQAAPGAFVAFPGTAELYAGLLSCRAPPGAWTVAAGSAAALAHTYSCAQVISLPLYIVASRRCKAHAASQ